MRDDSQYPNQPGSRRNAPETSFIAAGEVADAAKSRECDALALIRSLGMAGATADEVAFHFDWERYSSRPRLSALKARKQIVDSGNRRKGVSGKNQAVLISAEQLQAAGGAK